MSRTHRAARAASDALRDDRGTTLAEVLVGMGVMVVFMGMFTGAMLTMFGATQKAQAVTDTANQVNNAFARLDTQVRYASSIDAPTHTATAWYQAFGRTDPTSGAVSCTQLRADSVTRTLQERTWTVAGSTAVTGLSAWTTLASGVANAQVAATDPVVPFTRLVSPKFEQLALVVVSTGGPASRTSSSTSRLTFTALNSGPATTAGSSTAVCGQAVGP